MNREWVGAGGAGTLLTNTRLSVGRITVGRQWGNTTHKEPIQAPTADSSVCVCETYIGKPFGTRVVPQ
jgi:hypothetical protein